MIIHFITKLRAHLDFFWVGKRGERGGVKESRVELAENRLILDQFLFTLLYFPSLDPNKP